MLAGSGPKSAHHEVFAGMSVDNQPTTINRANLRGLLLPVERTTRHSSLADYLASTVLSLSITSLLLVRGRSQDDLELAVFLTSQASSTC